MIGDKILWNVDWIIYVNCQFFMVFLEMIFVFNMFCDFESCYYLVGY